MGLFAAKLPVPLLTEQLSLPCRIDTSVASTLNKGWDQAPFPVEHSKLPVIDNIKDVAKQHEESVTAHAYERVIL